MPHTKLPLKLGITPEETNTGEVYEGLLTRTKTLESPSSTPPHSEPNKPTTTPKAPKKVKPVAEKVTPPKVKASKISTPSVETPATKPSHPTIKPIEPVEAGQPQLETTAPIEAKTPVIEEVKSQTPPLQEAETPVADGTEQAQQNQETPQNTANKDSGETKRFNSYEQAEEWGISNFEEWGSQLSDDEFEELDQYIRESYVVNGELRAAKGNIEALDEGGLSTPIRDRAKALKQALQKSKTPERVECFRSIQGKSTTSDGRRIADLNVGDVFPEYGFSSATLSQKHADQLADNLYKWEDANLRYGATKAIQKPVVLEIDVPPGYQAAYINAAYAQKEKVNPHKTQEELLLQQNTEFKVIAKREENNSIILSVEVLQPSSMEESPTTVKSLDIKTKSLSSPKYGCLLLPLPEEFSKELTDYALENIPDFHLSGEGRELRPHLTVKYGFKDTSEEVLDNLRRILSTQGPIQVKISKISQFKGNKDGDVLKLDVDSEELYKLNTLISQNFDTEDKFSDYKPHITLAYLDPKTSYAYENLSPEFLGKTITLNIAEYFDKDKNKTVIPLSIFGLFGKKDLDHKPKRITRDAFLYLAPKKDGEEFAQCKTCVAFTGSSCGIFPKGNSVKAEGSCGLYQPGKNSPELKDKESGLVTPKEAGYVERKVRCENCNYSNGKGKCKLYEKLNHKFPDYFDLDENIEAQACCNAQEPRVERENKSLDHKDITPPDKKHDKTPTIAIDFDGTIADTPHDDPHKTPIEEIKPREGAREALEELKEAGWRIIIWTVKGDVGKLRAWLGENKIPYDFVNYNPDQREDESQKISADVYVDNRAVDGSEDWEDVLLDIAKKVKVEHIILTGYSGIGKSTLAKALTESTGLPLHRIDDDIAWKLNKYHDAKDPYSFTPNTDANRRYQKLVKKLIRRALSKDKPHILEGCHFLIRPDLLKGHRIILLDSDEDLVVQRRVGRDQIEGKVDRDGKEKREKKAKYLYNKLRPYVEELKRLNNVEIVDAKNIQEWVNKNFGSSKESYSKALSYLGALSGGALVPPAKFAGPAPGSLYTTEERPNISIIEETEEDKLSKLRKKHKKPIISPQPTDISVLRVLSLPQIKGLNGRTKQLDNPPDQYPKPDTPEPTNSIEENSPTPKAPKPIKPKAPIIKASPLKSSEKPQETTIPIEAEIPVAEEVKPQDLSVEESEIPIAEAIEKEPDSQESSYERGKLSYRSSHYEPSKAKVSILNKDYTEQQANEFTSTLFGKPTDFSEFASLVGATDDAEVNVSFFPSNQDTNRDIVTISTVHDLYESERLLERTRDGLIIINQNINMPTWAQGRGLGTSIFAKQVNTAKRLGVSFIQCYAAKGDGMNGYYTWPRLGYDCPLNKLYEDLPLPLKKFTYGMNTVLDVMSTKEGRSLWRQFGPVIPAAKFDLSDNSRSLKVLNAYLDELAKGTKSLNSNEPKEIQEGEEIYLTPEQEEALERAWERIEQVGWDNISSAPIRGYKAFSGIKRDALGRVNCFAGGVKVECPKETEYEQPEQPNQRLAPTGKQAGSGGGGGKPSIPHPTPPAGGGGGDGGNLEVPEGNMGGISTPQCPGQNPEEDENGDGIADFARVGLPAFSMVPPDQVPCLPNQNPNQQRVAQTFEQEYMSDPDSYVEEYLRRYGDGSTHTKALEQPKTKPLEHKPEPIETPKIEAKETTQKIEPKKPKPPTIKPSSISKPSVSQVSETTKPNQPTVKPIESTTQTIEQEPPEDFDAIDRELVQEETEKQNKLSPEVANITDLDLWEGDPNFDYNRLNSLSSNDLSYIYKNTPSIQHINNRIRRFISGTSKHMESENLTEADYINAIKMANDAKIFLSAKKEESEPEITFVRRTLPSLSPLVDKLNIPYGALDKGGQSQQNRLQLFTLSKMPKNVMSLAKDSIESISIGVNKISEAQGFGEMGKIDMGPYGFPGKTYDDFAGGVYYKGHVVVVNRAGAPSSTHEVGHAIGDKTGLDHSRELIEAHKRLYPKLTPHEQTGGPGNVLGRKELFAESLNMLVIEGSNAARKMYDDAYIDWLEAEVYNKEFVE